MSIFYGGFVKLQKNSNGNILLFHIGIPKTGTTSLQHFLYDNNEKLKNQGWYYPSFKEFQDKTIMRSVKVNGKLILDAFLKKDDKLFDECMRYILSHVKNYNVIVSYETIWNLEYIENFFNKVLDYYNNVKVLVYLRRQDQYLESMYNQCVKSNVNETMTLSQFIEDAKQIKLTAYLDNLMKLENIFGDNLIVRLFEKESFQGARRDTISDFLSVICLNETDEDWQFPENVENRNMSLGSRLLEIERIINKIYNSYNYYAPFENFIRKVNNDNISFGEKDYYKILSPNERKQILNEHEKENAEIARRYFNNTTGQLFINTNLDIPYKVYEATSLEEEIIKLFSFILIRQEINLTFINSMQKKRKLAFFGAGAICRDFLQKQVYIPEVIIDNYVHNIDVEGIPVISANSIKQWSDYQIIITCTAYKEVERQLQKHRLKEGCDYIKWFDISLNGSRQADVFIDPKTKFMGCLEE